MALKRKLTEVFGSQRSGYRCTYCSLTFDRKPLNCPACG